MTEQLALELAVTVRHDGQGGVADDLLTPGGLAHWLHGRDGGPALRALVESGGFTADEPALRAVREVRAAVRALFARAVAPRPASAADAGRLMRAEDALDVLAAAAGRVPTVARLDWPPDGAPSLRRAPAVPAAPADRLAALLAEAAMDFLAGPERDRLRACPAPRCVRYFVKEHPRQEWCKPSCGNRTRVARHHARQRPAPPAPDA
ncbi:CGNR zinc finger domain-containing protein [Streptomyces sp. NPDC048845]|uniref:CGNR zinc finger domain-containing protein n=1 Tax=Streptomyces sp. NPDC048845 TaxID=3155390 RepID=UPI00341281A4